LDGGSEQNVLRCLRALFDHGYLDRPLAQLAALPISGPRPFIYALGRKTARALRENGHIVNAEIDRAYPILGPDRPPACYRAAAFLDASLEKAKLRYDFEFHLRSLEDVRRVARGILRDTTPALPPLG